MNHRNIAVFCLIGASAAALAAVGQREEGEAPAGFTTPTLGQTVSPKGELTGQPGSQSIRNGIL